MTLATIKIDMKEIQANRRGKADGYLPEVRRGTGVHTPKKYKKKNKDSWKSDLKRGDY